MSHSVWWETFLNHNIELDPTSRTDLVTEQNKGHLSGLENGNGKQKQLQSYVSQASGKSATTYLLIWLKSYTRWRTGLTIQCRICETADINNSYAIWKSRFIP